MINSFESEVANALNLGFKMENWASIDQVEYRRSVGAKLLEGYQKDGSFEEIIKKLKTHFETLPVLPNDMSAKEIIDFIEGILYSEIQQNHEMQENLSLLGEKFFREERQREREMRRGVGLK